MGPSKIYEKQRVNHDIQQQWDAIQSLCSDGHRMVIAGGSMIQETRPNDSYNLPFVLAYALLDQALNVLIQQGAFSCSDWQLQRKMKASKGTLNWVNYALVDAGRDDRNKLAHQAELFTKELCLKYVRAVGDELDAWGLIALPVSQG